MLTNEMQMRAELLGKVLETGVPPMQALDHARELWDFIDCGNNVISEGISDADLVGHGVIGLMMSEDGSCHRFGGSGRELDAFDFERHPVYAGIRTVHQDGHTMVEIPAFHVRVDHDGGLMTWAISDRPENGFKLHPAFRRPDGSAASVIQIGAYAAGRNDGAAWTNPGLKPWTSISFDTAQEQFGAIGPGWRMWSIYDLSAIQILAMIELGGTDMQELVGRGNVDGDGVVAGGDSRARWRGLHELWGNVWQMVDGLRLTPDGKIVVWSVDRPGSGEWVSTGVKYGPGGSHGFPARLHDERGDGFDLSLMFLPSEVTSDEDDALIGDWVWGHWEGWETVAYHGGSWSDGSHAGLFSLHLYDAPSNSYPVIGARLAKVI